MEAICRRAGVQLNYSLKLNQLLTTYHLTEFGMGASFAVSYTHLDVYKRQVVEAALNRLEEM